MQSLVLKPSFEKENAKWKQKFWGFFFIPTQAWDMARNVLCCLALHIINLHSTTLGLGLQRLPGKGSCRLRCCCVCVSAASCFLSVGINASPRIESCR